MSDPKTIAARSDWTQLLADPDLFGHLGELLRTYRETPAEGREQALLNAMRKIKSGEEQISSPPTPPIESVREPRVAVHLEQPAPVAVSKIAPFEERRISPANQDTPPFEPSLFAPTQGQDRRRNPRLKCFVAVELRIEGSEIPIWGNLSNTSLGGCFVETVTPVPTGVKSQIGLWVANGKIWVKGLILNGIVTNSSPCFGVRFKFVDEDSAERETRREFFRFIENTAKGYQKQHGYLAQIKR